MRKWSVVGLLLAAVVFCSALVGTASAGVQWVTKEIPWAGLASVVNTPADTIGITAVTDSNRTGVINTSDWAWYALSGAATGAIGHATVTVVATTFSNGASDSLYMFPEKGFKGVFGQIHDVINNGSAAFGNCLVKQPFATFGTSGIVFQGQLLADSDAGPTVTNIWATPEFRLNIFGDTTTQLRGCKVFLTYPKYVAP